MAPVGSQQVVQNTGAVERIQETLQQQMDAKQRSLKQDRDKEDVRKRKSVQEFEPKDQITINAEREKREGKSRNPDDEEPEEDEKKDEEEDDGKQPEAKRRKRLNVTV